MTETEILKSVTIKVISIDKDKIIGQEICKGDDNIIKISMNRNIYLGLLAEMKKINVRVDDDLNCFVGKIFTIVEAMWRNPPKDLNVEPIVFGVALRRDIPVKIGN